MRNFRQWSRRTYWLCAVLLVALFVTALFVDIDIPSLGTIQLQSGAQLATMVAATVAVLSLVSTAVSTGISTRRQRRQATIEAWARWSDATVDHRRNVQRILGNDPFTGAQARALIDREGAPLLGRDRTEVPATDVAVVKHAISQILNGLERIATGVEVGVYDEMTLRILGGSIIVGHFRRAQTYIEERRATSNISRRQVNAFRALENLCQRMGNVDQDRQHWERPR